jgi:hypothetical protein
MPGCRRRSETAASKEILIYLAFPAAQGCAAEIDDVESLISKPGENRIFAAALAEKARMALFRVSLKFAHAWPVVSGRASVPVAWAENRPVRSLKIVKSDLDLT